MSLGEMFHHRPPVKGLACVYQRAQTT
jgi:hypothetical protein